jgi:tetratricopeptide (TPR) repeat protein
MPIKLNTTRLTPLFIASLFLGCANSPVQSDDSVASPVVEAQELQTPKKALTGQTFFELLLAEIAINRGELGAAASIYKLLSEHEADTAVYQRAIALSQSIGDFQTVSALSQRWVEAEPNSEEPWQALSISAMNIGDIETASNALTNWLMQNPAADVSVALPHSSQLSTEQAEQYDSSLVDLMALYPKSHSLRYSHARMRLILKDSEGAESAIKAAIKLKPELIYQLFQYQIWVQLEQTKQATNLIVSLYNQHPTSAQVAVTYARHLYRFDRSNKDQLQILHTRFSNEPVIARSFARVAFEQGDFDAATAVFQRLIDQGFKDEGHYFLGLIHKENNLTQEAQLHFSDVQNAPYLSSALSEWARMGTDANYDDLISALTQARIKDAEQANVYWKIQAGYERILGNHPAAIEVYQQALIDEPDNTEYLYEQALLFAFVDNFTALEQNLVRVLELEPNNINAMNALGYTWADLNINLPQASTYIEKALSKQPNNPAFMDSKGWLLYRQGDADSALDWLVKAYEQLENDEVAAHIAEVLWALNDLDEAQKYYQKVVEINPQSPFIKKLDALLND